MKTEGGRAGGRGTRGGRPRGPHQAGGGRPSGGQGPLKSRRAAFLGQVGEEAASRHLESLGLRIIQRNYRCRLGEIDIIAGDGDIVCFVEVKARRTGAFGGGLEAVEGRKQAQVRRAASYYLGRYGDRLPPCRFDVAEVWLTPEGRPESVRLVRNAF